MITKKSEYDIQAENFLEKAKTTFKAEFLYNGHFFDDDDKLRDIYEITLKREGKKPYKFKFGQSIANSGLYVKRNPYGKTVYDQQMIRRPEGRVYPKAYDVLSCLTKYDIGTFGDFCLEFGYDEDSRKAVRIYFAVQKEYEEVCRLFGDSEELMEELMDIN